MAAIAIPARPARVAFVALCVVGLIDVTFVAFVLPRSSALITTYAASSDVAAGLDLAAGLALLAAGLIAWHERTGGSLGPLAVLAAIVWFAGDWVGWEDGPPLARSLAMLAVPFGLALVLHVALAAPRGRLPGGLARATAPGRRVRAPVLVPAALVAGAGFARVVALLQTPLESPRRSAFAIVFASGASALVALAGGIAWTTVRARRTRAVVAGLRIAGAAATPAPTLREVLARALGDPRLQVGYLLPGSGRPVDATGAPVDLPAPGTGRAITRIVRGGEPVAIVAHDASLLDGPSLEREIGAAARLSVDNERLQASVLAHLADLRASRLRIIETGDSARRRLERDLHDGAQQRLLALSYELRVALADARGGDDPRLTELLATATDEARIALAELRELAHGIHPAILTEAGLETALATVADTAPIPVELRGIGPGRHSEGIETAAYLVAVAGIEDAARRGATRVVVEGEAAAGALLIRIADDGAGPRAAPDHLADRVGALGGDLTVTADGLDARIPCA